MRKAGSVSPESSCCSPVLKVLLSIKSQHCCCFEPLQVSETVIFISYRNRLNSSMQFLFSMGAVLLYTNGIWWLYWICMPAETKPVYQEECTAHRYSSVRTSKWAFPWEQLSLRESSCSFFQCVAIEIGPEDCLHRRFVVKQIEGSLRSNTVFLSQFHFFLWWQKKETMNHCHVRSCFNEFFELSVWNSS